MVLHNVFLFGLSQYSMRSSKGSPRKDGKEDYRFGMIMVYAYDDKKSKWYLNVNSPETFCETFLKNPAKSPLLEELFKKAFENRYYLTSPGHNYNTSMYVGVLIDQKAFKTIAQIIGGIYLERDDTEPLLYRKTVNYNGHAYHVKIYPGTMDWPDTSKRDQEARIYGGIEWKKRLAKEKKKQ